MACSYKSKFVILVLLSISHMNSVAQNSELKREWSFKGQNGTAQVSATSFRHGGEPRFTALEIFPTVDVVTVQE